MGAFEDSLTDLVLQKYDSLPTKSKPAIDPSSGLSSTWVPLSGLVVTRGNNIVECVALATGMKCLPASKVPQAKGSVLHDWHAEVLAIRCLNHFLLQECRALVSSGGSYSTFLRRRREDEVTASCGLQPFTINENVRFHMYCSEAPCGDASMELVMRAQKDATPWPAPSALSPGTEPQVGLLKGRGYFSELGVVRRKPARGDSPLTLSKSCSDKLALKQCTSFLSSVASILIFPENAYLKSLILPASEYVPSACKRCFAQEGRLKPVSGQTWSQGYAFRPLDVVSTDREFRFSKRSAAVDKGVSRGSNISAVWNPRMKEILINGVVSGRKQTDPRGASQVSRTSMLGSVRATIELLALPELVAVLLAKTYGEVKGLQLQSARREVKEEVRELALVGWTPNVVDDFSFDVG